MEQEYRRLVENAITEGDYQRALVLYKEYNNPALRAYKEFYTQKIFSEYATIHRALQTPARVNVDSQTLTESENIAALPEKVTDFPADPGDLETLNQETRLALNQDWDKPEDSPYVDNNSLQNNNQHVSISDIQIHKSLGAKAKNYDVIDPKTGEFFQFAEGTKIQNAEVFAGYSTKKPLNEAVADGLTREFGGDPSKWQHAKGIGTLDYYGEEIKAEVHWFQEESIGKVKFKVKEWKE